MPISMLDAIDVDRITANTLQLVQLSSPTGDTMEVAGYYERLLRDAGCRVERHEFVPNNPTLVAVLEGELPGRTVIFNGHMDTVPLAHDPACIQDGRIYGRGSNDMKGSLACIAEVIRVLHTSGAVIRGRVMIVANSLHESPGGRGEDLYAWIERGGIHADAAIVMEGATRDCTIAQFGSATFEIIVRRDGEPSHQLYTAPGTPHPITVAAHIIQELDRRNAELEREPVADIGSASYFIGSVHSGQFYNQHPTEAILSGVRRYSPETNVEAVGQELGELLDRIAMLHRVSVEWKLEKVRDGYRVDKESGAVKALVDAARHVRAIELPLVGKKLVTDASIFASLSIPVLCHGPDQRTAHAEVEYVDISELELSAKVYLQFLISFGIVIAES